MIFCCIPCFDAGVRSQVHLSPSVHHLAVTSQSPLFPNRHYHGHTAGQSIDVDADPKHESVDIVTQMKQLALSMEHLKNEMIRGLDETEESDAHRDRVMYFCQVLATFVCDAFLGPLKYPSSFFGQLASTIVSEENVAFRKQVHALGAPTGVTAEILLEWNRQHLFDDEGSCSTHPPITKAEFIEVAKEMIADKTLTASSVDVLEKVFDVVYSDQMKS